MTWSQALWVSRPENQESRYPDRDTNRFSRKYMSEVTQLYTLPTILTKKAIISLKHIHRLVFVTEKQVLFGETEIKFLNIIEINIRMQRIKENPV
jgi:hypothetical protein